MVRDVQRAVAHNPYEGGTRVVIIDPADLLTDEAQNAFLIDDTEDFRTLFKQIYTSLGY